ncbi:AAA family ATPase [Botrimarina sp.]|uniref:AAA family ATPase n=1 Tax=Botrimarina sp. TaxID=2795802 RepID=UPI0032EF084B
MSAAPQAPAGSPALESILPPDLAAAIRARMDADEHTAAGGAVADAVLGAKPKIAFPPPPTEPKSLAEAGLGEGLVDALLLKALLGAVNATTGELAHQVRLSRAMVNEVLGRLRDDLLVTIKGQAGGADYVYQLTEAGQARARGHAEHANYADAAPVPLAAYQRAIHAQALGQTRVTVDRLRDAFGELQVSDELLGSVAQAVSDGRGLFLYGPPGNGKTTIAERLCEAFGKRLWIPRTVSVGPDLLRLYDESCHQAVDAQELAGVEYDRRWVLIKRPTVVVGGELTLEQLDPAFNPTSGVSEAPVQMKANGGVLVIDDFGRQRVGATELLNRLIVPLEKQVDYLSLASGRQARIPFEMLCVLSTNLEPRQLVDEAFLRRIPYKIEVVDPSLEQFRDLFAMYAAQLKLELAPGVVDALLEEHYQPTGRPMRFCHPRDLLRQVRTYCLVNDMPPRVDADAINAAVKNYFAGL